MLTYRQFLIGLICVCLLSSCNDNETLKEYNDMYQQVVQVEQQVQKTNWATISQDDILGMYGVAMDLNYDYNPMDLSSKQIQTCEDLKQRVENLRSNILFNVGAQIQRLRVTPYNEFGVLLESSKSFPMYLQRNETLYWDISGEKAMTIKVCNADSRSVLKTDSGKSHMADSLQIANPAIYFIEITSSSIQYVDYNISYKVTDLERLGNITPIEEVQTDCRKSDFGAKAISGVELRACLEEPRKFTLRGQLKAAFSGSSRGLVAVQIPSGATDILYSLRIDTSESDRYSDGQFHNNLTTSYNRIKFLGMPIYEQAKSNGILNTLLDDNRPVRDEDAYCNMYVFRNQAQAKLFQDGTKSASQLTYDVDYSTIGTQSSNGRIPTKGARTIYLAFENERMRYTNYLWVEVDAVIPTTGYYTTKYSLASQESETTNQ